MRLSVGVWQTAETGVASLLRRGLAELADTSIHFLLMSRMIAGFLGAGIHLLALWRVMSKSIQLSFSCSLCKISERNDKLKSRGSIKIAISTGRLSTQRLAMSCNRILAKKSQTLAVCMVRNKS